MEPRHAGSALLALPHAFCAWRRRRRSLEVVANRSAFAQIEIIREKDLVREHARIRGDTAARAFRLGRALQHLTVAWRRARRFAWRFARRFEPRRVI